MNVPQPSVVTTQVTPQVIGKSTVSVTELPKTGLPLAVWGVSALAPLGLKLRKKGVSSSEDEVSANSIWMTRELEK